MPHANRYLWVGACAAIATTAAVVAMLFKFFVVHPAYTPQPNGNYGELYGPVSYFRIPIYFACGLFFLIGVAGVLVGVFWRKVSN